jgi:hypothetical protein
MPPDLFALDALPADIKTSGRCVIWRRESTASGGMTKVPYVATDPCRLASSTNPETWRSFADAQAAVEDGKADGPGLVLGDGWIGLDIDHCVTAGELDVEARTIVEATASYTEYSPSETGIHILVRGALPAGRRKKGRYELYDGGRYFTLTGARVPGTPATIRTCDDAELVALHLRLFGAAAPAAPSSPVARVIEVTDSELVTRMCAATNGHAIEALWNGDVSRHGSRSEADLALCAHLAFWTNRDADRMDRLFRQSGLFRPKWDSRRGTETYGGRTIATAIAGCAEGYTGSTLTEDVIIDAPTIDPSPIAEQFPAFCLRLRERIRPADIITGLIPSVGLVMIHGQPRTLKTWTLQELCRASSTGTAAFGMDRFAVDAPHQTWYITEEDPEMETRDRFLCLSAGCASPLSDTLHVSIQKAIALDDPIWQRQMIAYAKAQQITFTVIDPIRASSDAVDQGPRELKPLAAFLRSYMRATGSALALGHHDVKPLAGKPDDRAKPQRASGGGIFSIADAPIHAELVGTAQTMLTPAFYKFAIAPTPFLVTLTADDAKCPTWVRMTGRDTTATAATELVLHAKIRDYLRAHPATSGSGVAKGIHTNKERTLAALEQLFAAHEVDSFQKGQAQLWSLTSKASTS